MDYKLFVTESYEYGLTSIMGVRNSQTFRLLYLLNT